MPHEKDLEERFAKPTTSSSLLWVLCLIILSLTAALIYTNHHSFFGWATTQGDITRTNVNSSTPSHAHLGNISSFVNSSLSSRPYLTVRPCGGRLGNQMFQYASLLGIADATHMRPIENKRGHRRVSLITHAFKLSPGTILVDEDLFSRKFETIKELGPETFTSRFMQHHNKDTMMEGYLQSYKYFDHIADRIRKEFTFKDDYMQKARSWIANASRIAGRGEMTTLIGIHAYRAGGIAYFENAMAYYRSKYTDALFVLTNSASAYQEKHLLANKTDIVKTDTARPPLDMAILSLCNHSIMTYGTFGWWSAWLAGGDVIYYGKYPSKDPALGHIRKEDYYPRHWIGMV